ncbi:TIR domain-containing protein [Acinetobacter sp. I-MWF]|uniref:TIR domain-containing protein n=1 Tax=Acinetobacter sp. I-MWF TaxID=2940517 RepID=UPI0021CADC77|nr:TIR domain-containing protein [Acinetobacter sp. I-MWF]MCT9977533.1 TIR domain-containing protein [Acinetobacter sp. I-MWF]
MSCHNLFISHSWSYDKNYEAVVNLLRNQVNSEFSFKDFSVPKNDPIHNAKNDTELYLAIENKIRYCKNVIILAGVYASYSKWIQIEIQIAKKLGKKIIAIEVWGSEKTSKVVKDNADYIVPWRGDSLVKAIKAI